MEPVLCWPATPWHGTAPGVWLIYPVTFHGVGKPWFFFSLYVSVANRFCIRGGTWGPHSHLCAGILFGLKLCRSCVPASLYEFTCVSLLLCLEDAASLETSLPLALRIVLPPLLNRFGIFVLVYLCITPYAFWLSALPLSYISQWYNFYSHRTRNVRL